MRTETAARQRKESGQALALANAGRAWTDRAIKSLRYYLANLKAEHGLNNINEYPLFTFEEFRVWATGNKFLSEPSSVNAWGALPRIAKREGLVDFSGMVTEAKRPQSHSRSIRLWRAV